MSFPAEGLRIGEFARRVAVGLDQGLSAAEASRAAPASAMRSPTAQRPAASWIRRIITLVVDNPGDAIYGAIAVGALLAAETPRRESYAKTVAAVVITLLLYWLAHSYADLAGERLRSGARLTARGLLATMLRELPILIGAAIPLATLLVCWIAGTGLSAAVPAAVWTSAGIVLTIELAAGLRGRLRGRQLLSQAFVGALLGSLIILLRGLLH